jgi:hypothetical protein
MAMKRLRNHLIGVDQGSVVIFSDFEADGPMWLGEGEREVRREVLFSEPFVSPPVVQTALEMWDFFQGTNMRAHIRADPIGRARFELVFRTWGDTRVARARASWLAIGEIANPDDWRFDDADEG